MSTETTPATVTVELDVESAYRQLVAHEQAYADFNNADEDDNEARLNATVDAVEAAIGLINEIVPRELSEQLHQRLQEEHPELVQEDPLAALIAGLLGGNLDFADTDEEA